MKKELLIILGIVFLLGAGISSFFFLSSELSKALRNMDSLESMTISIYGDMIYIDGYNVQYDIQGTNPFYCNFEQVEPICFNENGRLVYTSANLSVFSETGVDFNYFSDFLDYDVTYENGKYLLYSKDNPDDPIYRIVLVDGYVSYLEYSGGLNYIAIHFTGFNETTVVMPFG